MKSGQWISYSFSKVINIAMWYLFIYARIPIVRKIIQNNQNFQNQKTEIGSTNLIFFQKRRNILPFSFFHELMIRWLIDLSFDRCLTYLYRTNALGKWKNSELVGTRASYFRMNCDIVYTSVLLICYFMAYDVLKSNMEVEIW